MNRLQELREQKELTEEEVAKLINIKHQQQISRYELNDEPKYLKNVIKLAKLYETSLDYIFGLTDIKHPYPRKRNKRGDYQE